MPLTFDTTSVPGLRVLPGGNQILNIDAGFLALATDVAARLATQMTGLQEGVIDAGAYMVTQHAAGAGPSVDIASHVGSGAYVQDDSASAQALYRVAPTVGVTNVAVGTGHATLPRVDRVLVDLVGTVSVLAGAATSGATLDNADTHGAAAVPSSKFLLADVFVPATDTTIDNTQIRDRRKFARGAFFTTTRTSTYTALSTMALVDPTNLNPRIECTGNPIRVTLHSNWTTASGDSFELDLFVDGATAHMVSADSAPSASDRFVETVWIVTPSAGSHKIGPAFSGASLAQLVADASGGTTLTIEEIVRQSAANNSVTTG
jgi:hypothetical protein